MDTSSLHDGGRITHSAFSTQPYIFVPFIILSTHWVQRADENKRLFPLPVYDRYKSGFSENLGPLM